MFHNPGAKIKAYAKVIFWIGVVISVLLGVVAIGASFVTASYVYGNSAGTILGGVIRGILITAIGVLISWVSVLTLYGFGVIVENSDELVRINGGVPSGEQQADNIPMPNIQQNNIHPFTQQSTHTCPNCGQPVEEGEHFCRNCGSKLD